MLIQSASTNARRVLGGQWVGALTEQTYTEGGEGIDVWWDTKKHHTLHSRLWRQPGSLSVDLHMQRDRDISTNVNVETIHGPMRALCMLSGALAGTSILFERDLIIVYGDMHHTR